LGAHYTGNLFKKISIIAGPQHGQGLLNFDQ